MAESKVSDQQIEHAFAISPSQHPALSFLLSFIWYRVDQLHHIHSCRYAPTDARTGDRRLRGLPRLFNFLRGVVGQSEHPPQLLTACTTPLLIVLAVNQKFRIVRLKCQQSE